jgi:beta-1,4-mannooligosaccharide phosphorylase
MRKARFIPRMSRVCLVALLLPAAIAPPAVTQFAPPLGKWTRLSGEPVLSPRGDGFESAGTFNPAVIKKDRTFVMLYRAQDRKGTSSLGYATSNDGVHFTRQPQPVMVSEAPYITNLQNVFRLQRFFHCVYAATAVS